MSRKGDQDRARAVWLRRNERRAWLAYMRVQHRLGYEMDRQLQADSELSLAAGGVRDALSGVPGERMQVSALAAQIGWERSRLSHHARRMEGRGLVHSDFATQDRRATEIKLTQKGRR